MLLFEVLARSLVLYGDGVCKREYLLIKRTVQIISGNLGLKIMGRVRAKGKKLASTSQEDPGSGDEVKVPAQKRRGRPQKPLKDEIDEDEAHKVEEDSEDSTGLPNSTIKGVQQTGKKQKMNAQVKERVDFVKEENGNGMKSTTEETKQSNGFHSNRNRRKSKPHRAAEATVECN